MHKFLIQTINDEIVHDFAFHLKEAVKYNNWYYNEEKYGYILSGDILGEGFKECIPIGSIEFVLNFYETYFRIDIRPINIPEELRKKEFLRREVVDCYLDKPLNLPKKVFAKSRNKFKDYTEIVMMKNLPLNKPLIISDIFEIQSEWRAFVYNKELLDVKNYNGDFRVFPDVTVINEIIGAYDSSPTAYTLDVAVDDNNKTVIVEVHQFFSCGLYGFADYRVLPQMFVDTHKDILSCKY